MRLQTEGRGRAHAERPQGRDRQQAQDHGPSFPPYSTLEYPICMGEWVTKRVLEYARLAMGFANVRASRYGIR